ncbi:type II toxin-antitoxin system PemK/MazF family toxin [Ligilactobacillus salivarius]|uniref:type II toxin-antitoxin system PemK/MazF family toxin n=1 Tax=Ligilactobacillus salivarius TaxID=1624 RepID=UPI0039959BD2
MAINYNDKSERLDKWNLKKKELAKNAINNKLNSSNIFKQRSIYYAQLGENIGFELNQTHPVLVVSKDTYNSTGTAIVAPLSSGKIRNGKHILNCQYILYKEKYPFLSKDSVIKCDQIRCISSYRLLSKLGYVSEEDWKKISLRIRSTFF